MFDSSRLPLTAAYFESLPDGLESFPDCLAVRDAYELVLAPETEVGGLHAQGLVGVDFVDAVRHYDGQPWVPEVLFQCMASLMADLHGPEHYVNWSRESAYELYKRPLLRHLMRLLSPTLIVMGAASRWQTVRKGSTLATGRVEKDGDRFSTIVTLTHPEGLYVPVFYRGLAQAFGVAVEVSRGKNTSCELHEQGATETTYRLSWSR